jgi:hypothetical protein
MLIELELKLDIGRGGSGTDGLPAALVDGVCYHRGIGRGLIEPSFVQLGREA